jgi:hypothetical protein
MEVVMCIIPKCLQLNQSPPGFSAVCMANCIAQGCSDVQYFVDKVLQCALLKAIPSCGPSLSCIESKCSSEIKACLNAKCPPK